MRNREWVITVGDPLKGHWYAERCRVGYSEFINSPIRGGDEYYEVDEELRSLGGWWGTLHAEVDE